MCDNSHIARIITDSDEQAARVAHRAEMPDIFRFDKRSLWSEARAAAPVNRGCTRRSLIAQRLDPAPLPLAARQADVDWLGDFNRTRHRSGLRDVGSWEAAQLPPETAPQTVKNAVQRYWLTSGFGHHRAD